MKLALRTRAVTLLRILLGAAVLGPFAAFALVAAMTRDSAFEDAERTLVRQTDLLYEHSLRTFDAHHLVAERVRDLLANPPTGPDADKLIHERLKAFIRGLPQMYSIWVIDERGKLRATTVAFPAPNGVSFADRDYFLALRDQGLDLFVSEIGRGRVDGRLFFSIATPLRDEKGGFAGVIAVSADPSYFTEVFGRLLGEGAELAGLLRADGAFLARHPAAYPSAEPPFPKLPKGQGLLKAIAERPDRGTYTYPTWSDGKPRLFAYRKLASLPAYAVTARGTDDILAEWRADMARYLPLTLVASLVLGVIAWIALQRAAREEEALIRLREASEQRAIAETALRRAQRFEAMGQLTGGVAHDFNNLLQVISGGLLLLSKAQADDKREQVMASLEQAVRRGEGLTRQLLTFARRQAVAPTRVQLRDELTRLEGLLKQVLRGNVSLVVDAVPVWPVHLDLGELELAVLNLAVNARDAMEGAGTLTVRVRNERRSQADDDGPAGDFVALSVADTGTGIASDLLDKVFEPFFTTKEHGKGTGLGLSQVYGFTRQAGGFVTIASSIGVGTTVTLHLPRASESSRSEGPRAPEPPPASDPLSPRRILLVEDNPDIRSATAEVMRTFGHAVEAAENAEEALAILDRQPAIDLVLSDIMMPGALNGLDLARRIRHARPDLPVILATGYSESARDAKAEGFPILRKPYLYQEFERVARALPQPRREPLPPSVS